MRLIRYKGGIRPDEERRSDEEGKAQMQRLLYASQLGNAAAAIQDVNLGRARRLLTNRLPASGGIEGQTTKAPRR